MCACEWPISLRQRHAQALRTCSARIESTCFLLSADCCAWETEKVTLLGCRSSAVVPQENFLFLLGDTVATHSGRVSPTCRAGGQTVSETGAPCEHAASG